MKEKWKMNVEWKYKVENYLIILGYLVILENNRYIFIPWVGLWNTVFDIQSRKIIYLHNLTFSISIEKNDNMKYLINQKLNCSNIFVILPIFSNQIYPFFHRERESMIVLKSLNIFLWCYAEFRSSNTEFSDECLAGFVSSDKRAWWRLVWSLNDTNQSPTNRTCVKLVYKI